MRSVGRTTLRLFRRAMGGKHALAIHDQLGVDYRSAKRLVRLVRKRFRLRAELASAVTIATIVTCWIIVGVSLTFLGSMGWGPFELIADRLDDSWALVPAILGFGFTIFVAIPFPIAKLAGDQIDGRPFRNELRRCLQEPACYRCNYSLRGLDTSAELTCPECGHVTPARRTTPTEKA